MIKQTALAALLALGMGCASSVLVPPSPREIISSPLEQYIQEHAQELLEDHHFRRIEATCVSKEKTPEEMLPCAELIKNMLETTGAHHVQILRQGRSYPAVFGEFRSPFPQARTILIGGHYDVQPVEEQSWTIGHPFTPRLASLYGEQRLTGRGASDDGQAFTHLDAVVAYLHSGIPLPVNVKFFYEGGEERGSPDMDKVMAVHKGLLSADVALLTDSGNSKEGVPAITYRSRGIVSAYVRVKTGKNDPHSGEGGGIVCNAIMALEKIISEMFDGKTQQVTIPGFYDDVLPLSPEEEAHIATIEFDENAFFKGHYGAQSIIVPDVKKAMWTQPTLECHALYRAKGENGQIIPLKDTNKTVTEAEAYLTMRLVPNQDPLEIAKLFTKRVQELAALHTCLMPSQLSIEIEGAEYPAQVDISNAYVKLRARALEEAFGVPVQITPIGGTEPILNFYHSILGIPVIYDSFDTLKDNAHGNDESFSIKTWAAGVRANIRTYQLIGEEK